MVKKIAKEMDRNSKLFWGYLSKHRKKGDNFPIRYNKTENRITFRIKIGYYFELLMSEMMKLLEIPKSKVTEDEIDENVQRLEITELVLFHGNIVNSDYQHNSRVLYTFISK